MTNFSIFSPCVFPPFCYFFVTMPPPIWHTLWLIDSAPPLLNFFNFPHTRSGEAPGSRICPLHPDLLSDVLQANLPRGVDDLGGWSHRYLLGENFTNHFLHVMARFFYNRCCTQSDQIELYLKEVLGNKFSYKSSQKIWWFSKTSLWREMVMVTFLLWSPWMHFFH